MPFRLRTQVRPRKHVLGGGAYWRHLANTIEPSMYGVDAACCQITLTTCYYYYYFHKWQLTAVRFDMSAISNRSSLRQFGSWNQHCLRIFYIIFTLCWFHNDSHLHTLMLLLLLMVAQCNRADHIYFHPVVCSSSSSSFFLSFFPCLTSAVGDWMSAILPHMVWP